MNNHENPPKHKKNHPKKWLINTILINSAHVIFLVYLILALYQQEFRNAFLSLLTWFVLLFLLPDNPTE